MDRDKAAADNLSMQDRDFFKNVFELIGEAGERKGPDYVPSKQKKQAPKADNFDTQFPELVQELEDMTVNESNVPPAALKTVADLKKE